MRDAVDRGVPLREVEPDNNVTQELAAIILAEAAETETVKEQRAGILARGKQLFSRKAG